VSGWEKYATRAAVELEMHLQDVERVVAFVGPLIAEDARERMAAAAGKALGDDPFVTHYEWQAVCTTTWHPCAGKEQLVSKLERFGGRGRMQLVSGWDDFPDIETAS